LTKEYLRLAAPEADRPLALEILMKQRKRKALLQHRRITVPSSLPGVPAFLLEPVRPYDMTSAATRKIGFLPVLGERPSNPDFAVRMLAQQAGVKLHRFDL
jgi:hypothetical protein